jgi:energy-coupling factor transport system permease protein
MLVTWRYHPRGTFLESIDPRARWFTSFLVLFSYTVVQIWDIRYVLFFFALAMIQYFMARLKWKETRRVITFVLILVVVIIGLNAVITGRGGTGRIAELEPTPIWGTSFLTVEKVAFAVTQIIRMLATAFLFLIIPFTMDPSSYGVTFGGMGLPYRMAFSMDLAFRFVPTLARDFQITLDAQRARGYEIDQLKGGIFAMIRRTAPLIVPVVMNSIVNGEDIINAMDLRCFGITERTWINKLSKFRFRDYAWVGIGVISFVTCAILRWGLGYGEFYVPDFWYTLLLP